MSFSTYYPTIGVKLDDGAYMPERAHATDAGADLRTRDGFTLKAGESVEVDTGVHVELPAHTAGFIMSKSGLYVKHGIMSTGLVDEGFSGSIRVRVTNLNQPDPNDPDRWSYVFQPGEKITQLAVLPVCFPTYIPREEVRSGARGAAGYGSTGRL